MPASKVDFPGSALYKRPIVIQITFRGQIAIG